MRNGAEWSGLVGRGKDHSRTSSDVTKPNRIGRDMMPGELANAIRSFRFLLRGDQRNRHLAMKEL